MLRATTVALTMLLALPTAWARAGGDKGDEKGLNVKGELKKDDKEDKVRDGRKSKIYKLPMKAGTNWEINLKSNDFDAYLRLEDSSKKQLAEDDDSGGNLDAKIVFTAPKDDTYRIIATTFADNKTGKFTLTVEPATEKQEKLQQLNNNFQATAKKLQGEYVTAGTDDAKKQVQ